MLNLNKRYNILKLNKKGESPGEIFILLLFVISVISICFTFYIIVVKFNYNVVLNTNEQHAQEVALRIVQNPWPCLAYKDPITGSLHPYILNGSAFSGKKNEVENKKNEFLANCSNISHTNCRIYIFYYGEHIFKGRGVSQYVFYKTKDAALVWDMGLAHKQYFLPVAIRFSDKDIRRGGIEIRCDSN